MFVPGKSFRTSVKFVGKDRAYTRVDHLRGGLLGQAPGLKLGCRGYEYFNLQLKKFYNT